MINKDKKKKKSLFNTDILEKKKKKDIFNTVFPVTKDIIYNCHLTVNSLVKLQLTSSKFWAF